MATIGSLIVNLIANTSVFDRKLNASKTSLKGFVGSIATSQRQIMNFARGVMAAAGVAGLTFMVKKTMDSIDATAKLSDRLQIATEDMVALQHAAKISGMDTEGMNKAMETFVRRLGEVKMGVGQAKYALDALGLSAKDMANRNHVENLKLIADKINQLPTAADKASAAYYLFGRQGVQMLNLLQEGSEGIEAFRREAERLGITFSRLDAAKVEAANDAITRAKESMIGLVQTATIEMAPAIEAIANKLTDFATSGENIRGKMVSSLKAIAYGVAFVGDMVAVVQASMKAFAGAMLFTGFTGTKAFSYLLKAIEAVQHRIADFYNKIIEVQNKLADTKVGNMLGIEKADMMGKMDTSASLDAYASGFLDESKRLFAEAGETLTNLPTTKVGQWFADLEKSTETLKIKLEEAAKAKMQFADAKPLIDNKQVLESTKNVIKSIRSQDYLTRMERIEALRQYARENADVLNQVAEAHKLLNEEITNLEKSRVNQLRVYMAELREDMQDFKTYVSDKMAETARNIEGSMSNAFYGMMAEGKSFKDAMISFAYEIRNAFFRMLADILARQMMSASMSGIGNFLGLSFGGAPSAPNYGSNIGAVGNAHVFHRGGIVGRTSAMRAAPAAIFDYAPRLHGGLTPDEFPAILQRGESVLPVGAKFGAPNIQVNVINSSSGRVNAKQQDVKWDGKKYIIDVLVEDFHKNGRTRSLFKGGV